MHPVTFRYATSLRLMLMRMRTRIRIRIDLFGGACIGKLVIRREWRLYRPGWRYCSACFFDDLGVVVVMRMAMVGIMPAPDVGFL